MPARLVKNWIEGFVEYCRGLEGPEIFDRWTGVSVVASALQRKVFYDRGYFQIYPNFYITLVGPTGVKKTTSGNQGMFLLNDIKQTGQIEIIKGKLTSWYVFDFLGELTTKWNRCWCTIYAPEFKAMMAEINKTELVTALTDLYDSPAHHEVRLKSGVAEFKDVCINLLACSTPEWLTTGLSTDDISGGFTGRFIYVYSEQSGTPVPFPEDNRTQDFDVLRSELVQDLMVISQLKSRAVMDRESKDFYAEWYCRQQEDWNDERLRGYFSRKGDTLIKLCMVLQASKEDSMVIGLDTLKEAMTMLTKLEANMSRALSGVTDDPIVRTKDLVVSQLRAAPNMSLLKSEILQRNWGISEDNLRRAIETLISALMIKQKVETTGDIKYTLIKT